MDKEAGTHVHLDVRGLMPRDPNAHHRTDGGLEEEQDCFTLSFVLQSSNRECKCYLNLCQATFELFRAVRLLNSLMEEEHFGRGFKTLYAMLMGYERVGPRDMPDHSIYVGLYCSLVQ